MENKHDIHIMVNTNYLPFPLMVRDQVSNLISYFTLSVFLTQVQSTVKYTLLKILVRGA